MNIYLIGYRCTGKTSAGKKLAEKLSWRFIDTDQYIAEKAGMSVSEIVASYGWFFFRSFERQALCSINSLDHAAAATGGGIILAPANMEILKDSKNFTVWLQASPETIYNRMHSDLETRHLRPPLTENSLMEEIKQTLSEREPSYRDAADLAVDTDRMSVTEVCDRIVKEGTKVLRH